MPYPRLELKCSDNRIATTISMFTEPSLKEAHHLLCANFPNDSGAGHFGRAAAILMLISIAATSAVRHFSLQKNRPSEPDSKIFPECIEAFFPWAEIGISDREYIAMGCRRPASELRKVAATELYKALRNPLFHSGGAVSKSYPRGIIEHPFPGRSFNENDKDLCEWCNRPTLDGQEVLAFDRFEVKLVTRPLYWAVRKMIEDFAVDTDAQADIAKNHNIV